MGPSHKIKKIFALTLIIGVTVLAYSASLKNLFVWDDAAVVTDNDFVHSFKNLPLIFKHSYLTSVKDLDFLGMTFIGSGETSYRPVVTLSYFIDYFLWKLNPLGYHLTSLFFHVLNVILFYGCMSLLTKRFSMAVYCALLFALHPVNMEAVSVISFREDLLAAFFFILSVIVHIQSNYCEGQKKFFLYFFRLFVFLWQNSPKRWP